MNFKGFGKGLFSFSESVQFPSQTTRDQQTFEGNRHYCRRNIFKRLAILQMVPTTTLLINFASNKLSDFLIPLLLSSFCEISSPQREIVKNKRHFEIFLRIYTCFEYFFNPCWNLLFQRANINISFEMLQKWYLEQISIEQINFILNLCSNARLSCSFCTFFIEIFTFFNQWKNLDDFETPLEKNIQIRATASLLIKQNKAKVLDLLLV